MLKILYQDPAIVVCEKPFRVLSTDEPGGMPDCIRQALGRPEAEVRTVHRLDQVVGGLMVYALTPQAASDLSRQIREDRFLKEYLAVIHWRPREEEGTFLDLCGQTPRQGHPAGRPPLPGGGQPPGVLPGVHPAGDRADPPDPGPVLFPGPPPGGGPEVQQVPRSPGVADRPVVPPPGLYPPGDQPDHGFPFGSPWGGGLGALLPPVREKNRAGPAPVQTRPPARGSTRLRTLQVGGSEDTLGRSAPLPRRPSIIGRWLRWNRCRVDPATWVPRRLRRGSPAFFGRKREKSCALVMQSSR